MAKGAHVQGVQGFSLADAIDGTAPGGVSDDRPEPPPSRCRWTGCGTVLSIGNRPKKSRKPESSSARPKPDIPQDEATLKLLVQAEVAGHDTGLVEDLVPEKRKPIRRTSEPDDEQLCHVHKRATLDWHQGFSDVRPPHYPPEEPEDTSVRKKKV